MIPASADDPMRLAVFASGGGSNLGAILNAIAAERLRARVVAVVTDRPGAGALERAAERGIPTHVLPPSDFDSEGAFEETLLEATSEAEAVALAGYLKKIPGRVVRAFPHRMLNIHPALLPAFGGRGMYGRRVHAAVIEHGCKISGATVHLVDAAYDTGPIVMQDAVTVTSNDTPESLAKRVLAVEHTIYPRALGLLAEDRLRLDGRIVHIRPSSRTSPLFR